MVSSLFEDFMRVMSDPVKRQLVGRETVAMLGILPHFSTSEVPWTFEAYPWIISHCFVLPKRIPGIFPAGSESLHAVVCDGPVNWAHGQSCALSTVKCPPPLSSVKELFFLLFVTGHSRSDGRIVSGHQQNILRASNRSAERQHLGVMGECLTAIFWSDKGHFTDFQKRNWSEHFHGMSTPQYQNLADNFSPRDC